jgi:hypothetical protein
MLHGGDHTWAPGSPSDLGWHLRLLSLGEKRWGNMPTLAGSRPSSGAYDIRKGAAGYAGIMGSVAGFVVPTVILAFTLPHQLAASHKVELTLATGLLVLSLLGCLASAFALAAISGEKELTMNLPAAAMYVGVSAIFAITAILGAFEVFAHIYLPSSAGLFGAMTVGGGIAGAIYNAMSVIDDWEIRQADLHGPGAFTSRSHAQRWALWLSLVGIIPVAAGALCYALNVGVDASGRGVSWFTGIGLAATLAAVVLGMIRSIHPSNGPDIGVQPFEAIMLQLAAGFFVFALLIFLPS